MDKKFLKLQKCSTLSHERKMPGKKATPEELRKRGKMKSRDVSKIDVTYHAFSLPEKGGKARIAVQRATTLLKQR